ncbi:MAG: hypothetical protein HYR58_01490 [Acidobacteria bacterium]|nr:hypothetical protein [Acidobacteriota bacterium]
MSDWIGNDQRLPQGRLAAISYLIAACTLFLLIGFWKLQIIQSDHYGQLAERNRIRSIPIIAPRGQILDREKRVIVDNYPSFSVWLLREDPKLLEQGLPLVAEGLGIPLEEILQQIEASKNIPKFQPLQIKPEASQADIAFIESHRADLPLLELLMVHRRRYPRDGFMAHAIGYVGEVSEKQIEASGNKLRPGDFVGKSGLERQYNETLMGTDGMRRVVVNSVGKEVERLEHVEAQAGEKIQLTIDYDLQVMAEAAMKGQKGAVVALDPRTGEVLAMVSRPAPDPNSFAIRIPAQEWKQLNEDPDKPLLNRAIQAQLAPGSVFKIVMSTAMLESKTIPEDFSVFCPGYADFYGRKFKCWVFGTMPSFTPATFSSTTSASGWGLTASPTTPTGSGWAGARALTSPVKWKALCLRRSGSSARLSSRGTPAKRSPWPWGRARRLPRRYNWRAPSEASRWAACSSSRTC